MRLRGQDYPLIHHHAGHDHVEYCLANKFDGSGLVLQDLINELGRRLDYSVKDGRYQGVVNAVGFDGIWSSPELHSIVVETKTTDAFRISLDNIAGYRRKLGVAGEIELDRSSILVVVGRQDTGELEAQVRGSRHAWDIRIISADALLKLVQLKESAEDPELIGRKIRNLLAPVEYTRLDDMIDVVFATAKDAETAVASEQEQQLPEPTKEPQEKSGWEFTDSNSLQAKREDVVREFARERGVALIRRSRALYWDSGHSVRAACTVSKHYDRSTTTYQYWYAYHPAWDEFLGQATDGFLILACMDLEFGFAIPRIILAPHLNELNCISRYMI